MSDQILSAWLKRQYEEGMALAEASDLLELLPEPERLPPRAYIAEFSCKGLLLEEGHVVETDRFAVGIWFPEDYLRRADPFQVLTWLGPPNVFHPNISDRAPIICVGHLSPGTGLVDIVYQLFEIVTFKKVTMKEDDALNPDACAWSRVNQHRFPIDDRPLRKRVRRLQVNITRANSSMREREGDGKA
jgi:hypothetical protein